MEVNNQLILDVAQARIAELEKDILTYRIIAEQQALQSQQLRQQLEQLQEQLREKKEREGEE